MRQPHGRVPALLPALRRGLLRPVSALRGHLQFGAPPFPPALFRPGAVFGVCLVRARSKSTKFADLFTKHLGVAYYKTQAHRLPDLHLANSLAGACISRPAHLAHAAARNIIDLPDRERGRQDVACRSQGNGAAAWATPLPRPTALAAAAAAGAAVAGRCRSCRRTCWCPRRRRPRSSPTASSWRRPGCTWACCPRSSSASGVVLWLLLRCGRCSVRALHASGSVAWGALPSSVEPNRKESASPVPPPVCALIRGAGTSGWPRRSRTP